MSVKSVTEKAINYIKEDKVRSIILGLGSVMGIFAGVAIIDPTSLDKEDIQVDSTSEEINTEGESNA